MRPRRVLVREFEGRWRFEREAWAAGCRTVAGVDEAGRGPLAGPVVAAAVIVPPDFFLPGLDDSKQLTAAQRDALYPRILAGSTAVAVGMASVPLIDAVNILRATFVAMRRAIARLPLRPDLVLVDGRPIPDLDVGQRAITGGDGLSNAIAAASVVAKVTRDRLMYRLDPRYPAYGFARNKGYGTPEHLGALARFGPCPLHRRSFGPVARAAGQPAGAAAGK